MVIIDDREDAIDLFCGAGGITQGIMSSKKVKVTHAVNHSPAAIKAHSREHPEVIHIQEDIENPVVLKQLPTKTFLLHASLECDHHSIAKGGQSRDAKNRALANHMEGYVLRTNPEFFTVENVKEFKNWGPVIPKRNKEGEIQYKTKKVKGFRVFESDKDGNKKPIMVPDPKLKGTYYYPWVERICSLGYKYKYALLNAADYGCHTSRTRYFGVFYRPYLNFEWPKPTHAKNPGLSKEYLPWNACREHIDLENEGNSIFGREFNMSLSKNLRRPLKPASLKRIAQGIEKFVLKDFIAKAYGGDGQYSDIEKPLPTITTKDHNSLVTVEKNQFISQVMHKSSAYRSIDQPLPTIVTRDEKQLVTVDLNSENIDQLKEIEKRQFIIRHFKNPVFTKLNDPLGTITTVAKDTLITVDMLCDMISDIRMRYLNSEELADITGFRKGTYLGRTETERKEHIGNAVPPIMATMIALQTVDAWNKYKEKVKSTAA